MAIRNIYRKMHDIVELYLNALEMYQKGEILLSVDEKTCNHDGGGPFDGTIDDVMIFDRALGLGVLANKRLTR